MASSSDPYIQPEKNRDPAEADRDPEQLTTEGKHGIEYPLYKDTEEGQAGGDRNNRVNEFSVNDHNTEPCNAPAPNNYETGSAEEWQPISNHSLIEELAQQRKLTDDTKQNRPAAAEI